jgi:hypothetical protein
VGKGEASREREVVSQGVFFALFRVVEIDELSGPEKALEWARAMVDEPELRRGFTDGVLRAFDARAEQQVNQPDES